MDHGIIKDFLSHGQESKRNNFSHAYIVQNNKDKVRAILDFREL